MVSTPNRGHNDFEGMLKMPRRPSDPQRAHHRRPKRFNLSSLAVLSLLSFLAPGEAGAFETELREEARYISGQIAGEGRAAVAVVDFTDLDGAVTHLGRFMAEELSVELAGASRSFQVVDRSHLRSLVQEHKLAAKGLIDPSTARELGRIAGVDTLVTATLTPLGDSVRLSIKVLDSESAQVLSSSSCNIPKTQAVDSLLRRGVAISLAGGSPAGTVAGGGSSFPTVEREGIIFALQGCQRSNETITCHLTLTNQTQDKSVDFNQGWTRAIDPFGDEFYASMLYLGSSSHHGLVSRTLVRGISMKARADFEGLPREVRRLALVEFYFGFAVQFRDVPVS